MTAFRIVPAFVVIDADVNLGADLCLSDHPDAVESDPRVFIHDRHYGTQIGIALSDLRRMVLAIEQAADRHTDADQAGRLGVVPALPVPMRAETPEERAEREERQEAERQARKADEAARHAEALRSVTDEERALARKLSNSSAEAIGALTCGGIGGIQERGVWRFVKDNESYSRAIKRLKPLELVDVSYYTGGKASAHLTDAGVRIALALELVGRLDPDGDLLTDPAAIAKAAGDAVERSVTVYWVG